MLCAILILFVKNNGSLQLITLKPYLTVSFCCAIACASAIIIGIIIGIIFNNKKCIFISIAIGIAGGALIGNFCANLITNGESIGIKINFFILLCAIFGGGTGGILGILLPKISSNSVFGIKFFKKKIVLINLFIWLLAVIAVPFALDYNSHRTMAWAENLLQKAKINGNIVEVPVKSFERGEKLSKHLAYKPKSTMIKDILSVKKLCWIDSQKLLNGEKNICLKWIVSPNWICTDLILFSLGERIIIKIPHHHISSG